MRYLNGHDARMRLDRSFCRFEDIPVFVRCDEDNLVASLYDLKTGDLIAAINPNDERLDVASLPLGYCNFDKTSALAVRYPYRQQKQGISNDNTRVTFEDWDYAKRQQNGFSTVPHKVAYDLFQGIYPEFPQALKSLSKATRSKAFHRKLSLVSSKNDSLVSIRYAGKTMGFILKGRKKALILDAFSDPSFRILLSKLGVDHEILKDTDDADDR